VATSRPLAETRLVLAHTVRVFQRPPTAVVRGSISVIIGFLIWEILARLLLENELLIPPPTSVLRSMWKLTFTRALDEHFTSYVDMTLVDEAKKQLGWK
jgi:ABC-type nitrate/sulfonate/bicarbonate transport system permease component